MCRAQLGGRKGEPAAYLTPIPPGAVVYGSGEGARILTKVWARWGRGGGGVGGRRARGASARLAGGRAARERGGPRPTAPMCARPAPAQEQAAALRGAGLGEYADLKGRLLLATALLAAGGSGAAALAGGAAAAVPFALGGAAGVLYQFLLQLGADAAISSAAAAAPAPALRLGLVAFVMDRVVTLPRAARQVVHAHQLFLGASASAVLGHLLDADAREPYPAHPHQPRAAADVVLGSAAGVRRLRAGVLRDGRRQRHHRALRLRHRHGGDRGHGHEPHDPARAGGLGFALELPPYRVPMLKVLLRHTGQKTREFVVKAGTVIFTVVVILWFAMSLPWGVEDQRDSYFGQASAAVAPVFAPAGFGTWQATGALATGFIAKEVVVSTMGQIYVGGEDVDEAATATPSIGEDVRAIATGFVAAVDGAVRTTLSLLPGVDLVVADEAQPEDTQLSAALGAAFTPLAAVGFLVFVLVYTPCVATLAAIRNEFGWRWAALSGVYQFGIAWLLAVVIFQVGTFLGYA